MTATVPEALIQDGIAVSSAVELGISDASVASLQAEAIAALDSPLVAKAKKAIADGTALAGRLKSFMVKVNESRRFPQDHPMIVIGKQLAPLASAYFGEPAQFYCGDSFVTLPVPTGAMRQWSQGWHRDSEGSQLFKVFLYLSDVGEDCGPTEYILGSSRDRMIEACGLQHYPNPPSLVETHTSPEQRKRYPGPMGTVLLMDTGGIHRGGYSHTRTRLHTTWTYLRPQDARTPLWGYR